MSCSICLDGFDYNSPPNKIIKLNCCNKRYHFECIFKWILINKTCPCCRQDIPINYKKPFYIGHCIIGTALLIYLVIICYTIFSCILGNDYTTIPYLFMSVLTSLIILPMLSCSKHYIYKWSKCKERFIKIG